MSTSNLKKSLWLLLIAAILLMPVIGSAQPPKMPPKAMEKIETVKKVKLLEVLELPEADAEKVLIKYNSYENKIKEMTKKIDEAIDKLNEAVREEDYKNIDKLNDDFLRQKKELDAALDEKMNGMKQILTKEQFAKYILFERKFQEELRRAIMDKIRDRKEKRRDRME